MATFTNTTKSTTTASIIASSGSTPTYSNTGKSSVSASVLPVSYGGAFLLLEDLSFLLQENADKIVIGVADYSPAVVTNVSKS